jgi:hypothetical protein
MNERPGQLNEALEESMILILALQPKVLEYVMRLVILLGIEANEIG